MFVQKVGASYLRILKNDEWVLIKIMWKTNVGESSLHIMNLKNKIFLENAIDYNEVTR